MQEGATLYSRTISAFPISIGTSLALESLFNPRQAPLDPDRKFDHVDVSQFTEAWINVSTLFRNMVGSVSKEGLAIATEAEMLSVIQGEIEIINDLFQNEGQGFCKPQYYRCSYENLVKQAITKNIPLRQHKAQGQLQYQLMHDNVLAKLDKASDEIHQFDSEIKSPTRSKALIITSNPYDLLSHANFHNLQLLESHTGKLKPRALWNSKYFPMPEVSLDIMPFNRMLLFTFGDKIQIQPSPIKLRRQVYDVAVKRNWTPMSTVDKVKYDLSLDIKEPFVLTWLKSL